MPVSGTVFLEHCYDQDMAEAVVAKCATQEDVHFVSLLCTEPDHVIHAFCDRTFLYDDRILHNLLTAEEYFLPNATYFDFQPEIKPQMRRILANWMFDVCFNVIMCSLICS
jgi:Cyclin, N-terminal domain